MSEVTLTNNIAFQGSGGISVIFAVFEDVAGIAKIFRPDCSNLQKADASAATLFSTSFLARQPRSFGRD